MKLAMFENKFLRSRSKLKRNDSVRTQKSINMLDANMRLLGEIQVKTRDEIIQDFEDFIPNSTSYLR